MNRDLSRIRPGKVCIYGTGAEGRSVHDYLTAHRSDIEVVYFANSFESGIFQDKPLLHISQLKQHESEIDYILVASHLFMEIMAALDHIEITCPYIPTYTFRLSPHPTKTEPRKIDAPDPEEPDSLGPDSFKAFNSENLAMFGKACYYIFENNIPGDIAEFGVLNGETAQRIARILKFISNYDLVWLKKFHLFDSFQGLPETDDNPVDRESPLVRGGYWVKGAMHSTITVEELREMLSKYLVPQTINIVPGYYCDTMKQLPDTTRFALIHLDCDLYSSTIDVLDYVLARKMISPGAVILFDDWNCNMASNEFGQRRAWREMVEKYAISYSQWGYYGWAGYSVFVHDYK